MRIRKLLPFIAGALLGAAIVTAGSAGAAIMRTGWDRFDEQFQMGYIAGFLDLLLIARNEHPGGPLDRRFPHIIGAKNHHWHRQLNEAWKREDLQGRPLFDVLYVTAHELKAKFKSQNWVERQRDHQRRFFGLPVDDKAASKLPASDEPAAGKKRAVDKPAPADAIDDKVDPARVLARKKRRLEERSKKVEGKAEKFRQRAGRIRERAAEVPVAPDPPN